MRHLLVPLVLLAGCEVDEDGNLALDLGDEQVWIDATEYHLAASTTAAWMSTIAVGHYADGSHPCATEEPDGSLTLTPGPACPHALLESLDGTATIDAPGGGGYTFSGSAEGLSVGGRGLLAQQFTSLQASPTADQVTVAFSTSDYGEDRLWGWVVVVDTKGTPALDDDAVTLNGATFTPEALPEDHVIGNNEVGITSTLSTTPGCRKNPTSGSMIMEGHTDWPLLDILAPKGCDGTLQIDSTNQEAEWTPTLDLFEGQAGS